MERRQAVDAADQREVVDLLIDQIEFADVILLNKTDLIEEEDRIKLTGILSKLNLMLKFIQLHTHK